ncbi:hypothetical protein Ancab_022819, partial [Ancistrocladus abbreviatus]
VNRGKSKIPEANVFKSKVENCSCIAAVKKIIEANGKASAQNNAKKFLASFSNPKKNGASNAPHLVNAKKLV